MNGRGEYSGSVIGTPEFDAKVLRVADERMRRLEKRALVAYGTHVQEYTGGVPSKLCHGSAIGGSLQPGLLFCTGCGEEFNRNNVRWHGDSALVMALTVYELDDGNPAEAGRVLAEAIHEALKMSDW